MKVLSILFTTVPASSTFTEPGSRAGIVLAEEAGSGSELGDEQDTVVEALIDVSVTVEASEVFASSETQKSTI